MAREMGGDKVYRAFVMFKMNGGAAPMIFGPYDTPGPAKSYIKMLRTGKGNVPLWYSRGRYEFVDGWVEECGEWTRIDN